MVRLKIGLIREGKTPHDRRVALTPHQCKFLKKRYPHVEIICQPSPFRSYTDDEFTAQEVTVQEDISACDFLFGIKEVPVEQLISDKTYFFFSHTLKKQPYNRKLLQEILKKNITLIDYEAIKDDKNERLVAFGKYAGIVGAYNAFRTISIKYKLDILPPAHTLFDKKEMIYYLKKTAFPPLKIVITGSGRVAKGVKEIMEELSVRQVSPSDFLNDNFDQMVYTIPKSEDYYSKSDGTFDRNEFYTNPSGYSSTFKRFTKKADVLIAAAYWNPAAPRLFSIEDIKDNFNLRIIADITCDINGSIPTTVRSSTIYDPFYDFNPDTLLVEAPFSRLENITIMAIDNLPTELPRDASEFFGDQLLEHIFPALLEGSNEEVLSNSIIAKNGRLTEKFAYLENFAKGI